MLLNLSWLDENGANICEDLGVCIKAIIKINPAAMRCLQLQFYGTIKYNSKFFLIGWWDTVYYM